MSNGIGQIAIWVPHLKEHGFGHFYRTLGLYEKLSSRAFYFFNGPAKPPVDVNYKSFSGTNPADIEKFLLSENVGTLYIDNYLVTDEMLNYFSTSQVRVVYFDNRLKEIRFAAVVNSNPYAHHSNHHHAFLGTKYYFFRREMTETKNTPKKKNTIFICFGGSDVQRLTKSIAPFLDKQYNYLLVLGPGCSNEYVGEVEHEFKAHRLTFELHHRPDNYFALLSSCENAILTSSTSAYEADFLGIKYVCFEVAADQDELAALMRAKGVVVLKKDSIEKIKTAKFNRFGFDFSDSDNALLDFLKI